MRLIRPDGHLAAVFRAYAWLLPVVAVLGVLAGLLEGAGIGLLIPLIALLLADEIPAGVPAPIRDLAMATDALDTHARIFALGGVMIGFIFAKGLILTADNILIAAMDARIARDLRNALCEKLLALDYPFFLRNERARLIQIISNDCWFASDAVRAALNIVPAAVTLVVFGVLLLWLNWQLTLIVGIGAVLIEGVLLLIERRQRRLSLTVNAITHRLGERMLAVAGAMRTIRVFGQQSRELAKFAEAAEGVRRSFFAIQRVSVAVRPLVEVLISGVFVMVLLAAYRMGISIPEITAYLVLLSRTQPYAQIVSRSRVDIAAWSGSLRQMEWLLAQEPAPASLAGTAPTRAIYRPIRFEQVSYAYPDGSPAVHEVTLAIEPGTATALIGKSGAGKTTLINLLCRLVDPTAGALFHGDEPLAGLDPAQWRKRIALAGQDADLLDGTVAENIAYARPDASREEIEDAARAAGAARFIGNLPAGYDTRLGLEGLNLSGGQRQRIGLARALLRKPDLLILDEATSAVDAISETEIMTLLKEHRHFRTALVISHRRSTLAACQQGIVIRDGRIVEVGPLRDLSYYEEML
jgi:subfamily B ATP-binding cassette protein MsbA